METEADKLRAHGKAAKELKMSEKYEVELAALNAESCSPLPGPLSSPQPNTPQTVLRLSHGKKSRPPRPHFFRVISSDFDSDQESHDSGKGHSVERALNQKNLPCVPHLPFDSPDVQENQPRELSCNRDVKPKNHQNQKDGKSTSQNLTSRRS